MESFKNELPDDEELNESNSANDAVEEDETPVLDEQGLGDTGLSEEEAERIEWDEPDGKKGSSGSEEKDITD